MHRGSSSSSSMLFKIAIFVSLMQHLLTTLGHHHYHSLHTDRAALLAFKSSITSDPHSSLANWDELTPVCNYTGVQCSPIQHRRVVYLNLNASHLTGLLPRAVSNLTQLRYLHLADNNFFGPIPWEISSIRNLLELKLGKNNLQGQIPASFSLLSNLKLIHLYQNSLTGAIPATFFANCTGLKNIDFSSNQLTGTIPSEIGNCPDLWAVSLYDNQLVGEIPSSLGNATGMLSLDVENNSISGQLPAELISRFVNLSYLHLSDNHMTSHDNNTNLEPFFAALANCTELEELELAGLGLGGTLPSSIARLSDKMTTFQLQGNMIHGPIPSAIWRLSKLTLLNLTSNFLVGKISPEIANLSRLEQLCLSNNFFTEIPAALGQLSSLGLIDVSHNNLTGQIPDDLGNLASLNFLFLNNNLLSGEIPSTIGGCLALLKLDLSHNFLTGRVPPNITNLQEMRFFLNLSHNQLNGPLPVELSKLEKVEEIDLSFNRFNGTISSLISSCDALKLVNFSNNSIQGALPQTLGDLKSIVAMDFSNNKLSGKIPASLNKSKTLAFLNLSGNSFEGMIPTGGVFTNITKSSFLNNPKLCGSVPGIPPCKRKHYYFRSRTYLIIFCVIIFVSGFLSTIGCVIGWQRVRVNISRRRSRKERKESPELTQKFPRMTYKELVEATAGFDNERLVGSGSYGRVYRGSLPDGTQIAVKVLQLQTSNSTKVFNRECQILKRIRHRNLIRIITACSLPEFKAFVLPYMANGSLDAHLYPPEAGSAGLTLLQRVNICSDIAEGMAYLHHHSPVKVIHCDLKPSNVLLNDDMTALVSDFGISRLVMTVEGGGMVENAGNSTANMLCGSIGYIAPEYGFGAETSTKGDVYSFGVVVLEMVTRKRPTDEMFVGGMSLHGYVKSGRMENVVDHTLVGALRDVSPPVMRMWEVAIGELIELGLVCTHDSPTLRPTMLDCADDLDRLKSYLSGDTTATFSSSLGVSSSTFNDS
ncbi:putative leucine-rich repeat receptor-like serine/threonine-protein kinase At2g24130 [Salvia hispanica]|uniref:putative leucine-rich repeat receptor-like serine/threonine-protein kinase At2g24130 n=1 Tax=Salvia hispanica TaxID=49212 RepID=UPI002008F1F4|nr:putative leucine-rich repeat receptor-like serine/threonine-protein kinase At2g24130 [Salvia hispanica]